MAAVVFLISDTAIADASPERNRLDKELAQAEATLENATAEAKEAGLDLAAAESKLPEAKQTANQARGKAAAAEVAAKSAARQADDAADDYDDAENAYTEAKESVERARDELGDVATMIYQGTGVVTLSAVLTADDAIEASQRYAWVEEVATMRSDAVESVVRERQNSKVAQNEAQVASDAADAAAQEAADAWVEAEAEVVVAEAAESDVKQLVTTKQEAKQAADHHREETLQRYDDAKAASEQVAQDLRDTANQASDSPDPPAEAGDDSATLRMPVQGWKSSDFGNRYDPYYKVWQLHEGTDFAAPGGAPIYAAESGTVATAGWNGGYGNYTCIYHGGSMSTCYGHQSSIGVSQGQSVSRGQYIGKVGSTGASTGAHLHFEVRINGGAVDPLGYLPSCLC